MPAARLEMKQTAGELHPKAVKNITRLTRAALDTYSVQKGRPRSEQYKTRHDLANEVLKYKKQWLRQINVYEIFADHVFRALRDKYPGDEKPPSGELSNVLGEPDYGQLVQSISRFFISIPREYFVYLPLPSLFGIDVEPIEIQPGISIKFSSQMRESDQQYSNWLPMMGMLQQGEQQHATDSYLCVKVTGYCGGSVGDSGAEEALQAHKLLLHAGLTFELFEIDEYRSRNIFVRSLVIEPPQHKIPKINLESSDQTDGDKSTVYTELPLDITRFIQNTYFKERSDKLKEATEGGKESLPAFFSGVFKKHAHLIGQRTPDAEAIKLAIEWGMNSRIVENKILSFMQICIALESILGRI